MKITTDEKKRRVGLTGCSPHSPFSPSFTLPSINATYTFNFIITRHFDSFHYDSLVFEPIGAIVIPLSP